MKENVYKVLPFIVGIVIGWLVVFPPEFLGLSVLVRVALLLPLAALAALVFFMFLITASLPEKIQLTPIDQRRVTEDMVDLFNEYQNAGFELGGAPLKIGTNPPAVLVPLIDSERKMYGTIYRTGTDPPKTSNDIVSIFDTPGGLTTGSMPEGASLPAAPGSFYQVFPGSDILTLRRKHAEALAYLESQGLHVKPATATSFPDDFRNAISRMRSHFLSNPIWHTLVTVWRSTTGNTPHLGPVQQQAIALKSLQDMRKLP